MINTKQIFHYPFIVLAIMMLVNTVSAKIDPPNYNFSVDALEVFQPNKMFKDIEAKYGKGELIEDSQEMKTYKFYVAHIRYKFPVYVQIYKKKSLGFFAKLPTYFLHDLFHQSLINRFGKQDSYFKKELSAIYQWKNKDGIKHTYNGSCTITCFPVYYAAALAVPPEIEGYQTILKKFTQASALRPGQ
jgi:hypothetical protein